MPGPYLNSGIFRTTITETTSEKREEFGVYRFESGKIYRYVKAGALIPAGEAVVGDHSVTTAGLIGNQVVALGSTTNMLILGVAEATLSNLGHGWITVHGPATARVVTNAPAGAHLGANAGNAATPVQTGVLNLWSPATSLSVFAIALQTGLSAGSAIYIKAL